MFNWQVRCLTLGYLVCTLGLLSIAHAQTAGPASLSLRFRPSADVLSAREARPILFPGRTASVPTGIRASLKQLPRRQPKPSSI